MKTRKLTYALAVAALIALAIPAVAMANFGPHGNYTLDTDACAGCHRAHTSYSSVTWSTTNKPGGNTSESALLVGATTEVWEFCYVCHGADAPGADTNVEQGIYEGAANGTPNDPLNSGGFGRPGYETGEWTSTHMITGGWGAFGGETTGMEPTRYDLGTGPEIAMGCGACHDVHGSPNYRILKPTLAGSAIAPVYVGGWDDSGDPLDPDPDAFVRSSEPGFPLGGFRLGTDYEALGYAPNYTTPMYAKGYSYDWSSDAGVASLTEDADRGMSGWCAGCHTQYINESSPYAAGEWVGTPSNLMTRHRHPMNTELDNYYGPDRDVFQLKIDVIEDEGVPVAHDLKVANAGADGQDWIECLSCHRAHGTKATMTKFATEAGMASVVDETGFSTNPYVGNQASALLRLDNRGVCQACHNK